MQVIDWRLLLEPMQVISSPWYELPKIKIQMFSETFLEYIQVVSLFDMCCQRKENQM